MARRRWTYGWTLVLAATLALTGCSTGAVQQASPLATIPATATSTATDTTAAATATTRDISGTAVLLGDSQSGGAAGVAASHTWVNLGLQAQGYTVDTVAAGGTGFVAHSGKAPNYLDAVESGKAVLPQGDPGLMVIQGGGNDAALGATDAAILANATRLLKTLRARYPDSKFLLIGTLAKGSANGGGRRTEVDTLLAGFAQRNELPFIGAGDWLSKYHLTHQLADKVHLTASGHVKLAKVLAARLKAMGLQAPAPQ